MELVFIHCRQSRESGEFHNEKRELSRVACVGEYLGVDWDSAVYRVEMVEHITFTKSQVADVYAIKAGDIDDVWAKEFGIRPRRVGQ